MGLLGAGILGTAIGIKCNKKIEETYAVAAILIALAIYFPALFFSFTPGIVISLVAIGLSFVYIIFKLFTDRMSIKNTLFTWGGLALFAYFCFFVYYAYHRDFNHPDEFYCWGLMAKNYFYYNELLTSLSTAISGDHPPIMPVWYFFNTRFMPYFSESICYLAHDIFVISAIVPFFAHIKSRVTAPKFFVIAGSLPLILVLSGMEGFDYILMDGVIAAFLCFFVQNGIRYIETKETYYYVASILGLVEISLLKRMGIVFVSLALMCVVSIFIREKKYKEFIGYVFFSALSVISWFVVGLNKNNDARKLILMLVTMAIAELLFCYVIKFVDKLNEKARNIAIIFMVFVFAAFMLGIAIKVLGRDGYSYDVMARFCSDYIRVDTTGGFIKLSYGIYMILAVMMAAYLYTSKKNKIIRDILFFTLSSMTIYAVIMLYLHIVQIGPLNGNIEGLVPRYMIPWEILVTFLYFYYFIAEDRKLSLLKCLIAFMIIALISNSPAFFRAIFSKHQAQKYFAFENTEVQLKPGDMVYYVDENAYYGYADREFYYSIFPAETNFIYDPYDGTMDELTISIIEFKEVLTEQYNYLYLQTCTEGFIERYAALFGGEDKVVQGSAYYVVPDSGDGVILKKIEKQD